MSARCELLGFVGVEMCVGGLYVCTVAAIPYDVCQVRMIWFVGMGMCVGGWGWVFVCLCVDVQ
jgi:hypothetical protein